MSHSPSDHDVVVDSRGTLCPQPVIDLARAFATNDAGELVVVLLADDPAAVHDVPAWCRMRACTVVASVEDDGTHRFVVQRSA